MHDGAGAAGFPNRNRAALALIFGMHMLALFAWMQQRPPRLPEMPHVVSILLRPPAPQRITKPAEQAPPPTPIPQHPLPPAYDVLGGAPPTPAKPTAETRAEAPSPPATAPVTEPVTEPATEPATTRSLEDARAPLTVQDAIREQQQADGALGLNLSKRQAGRIDRELRKGKSGVPDEPDTPMGRFRRGLERAYNDRSRTVIEDSYTSPDGVVIYRRRIGNKSICYRSGSVSPLGMPGMLMPNEAGNVRCPSGVQWKKED
jgi:hypothetical protein